MNQPLVIAYHLIWTAYGWWLPNDPRGSGSHKVATDVIAQLGEPHFGRKAIQPPGRTVREFYQQAADVLKHPLLTLDDTARNVVAAAFAEGVAAARYSCYACVIIPDHVHILLRKHRDSAEQMIQQLQERSRTALFRAGLRPVNHPAWTWGGWKVFLNHPEEVRRTIAYIRRNPLPLGLPEQQWPFVTSYENWPLHPGHSPNSPYAVRLRRVGRYP